MTIGMPIWYELATTDVAGAQHFYGEIVGWTTHAFPGHSADGQPYIVWQATAPDETGIGGLFGIPKGADMSPGWLAYFHVADADEAERRNRAAGGTAIMPAFDIPGVGRAALLRDPQGARYYVMVPDPTMGDRASTAFSAVLPQRCNWNQLATIDHKAALAFYGDLFGWVSNEAMPMGEAGDYSFIDCGDTRIGAMMDRQQPEQPVGWEFFFKIPDVDAAVEQVTALGGRMLMGPMDVPGGQRIIVALDPHGAQIGFVSGDRA